MGFGFVRSRGHTTKGGKDSTRLVSLLRQSEVLATIVCGLRGTLRKLADFASMLLREFLSSTPLDHLFAKSIFEGHRS